MATPKLRAAREIFLFTVCFFAVWSIRATLLYSIDEAITSDTLRIVYASLVKLLLWVMPAVGFAYGVRRAAPVRYLGLSVVPSARQWLFSLAVTSLCLGAVVGLEVVAGRKALALAGLSFAITLPGVLTSLVSPVLEEILFRGLLLKEFSGLLPRWAANLLASLLFAGVHLPFWLSHGGWSDVVLANIAGVFFFSLVAGWLYLRSSSIWPAALAHVANNAVAALLVGGG